MPWSKDLILFDLSCLSLSHKRLSVINIIPSDCGISNSIPYPKIIQKKKKKITLFTLGKNCWEERYKWLLSLLFMSDTAHLWTKNQINPAGSEQSLVLDFCLCFGGEARVWDCAWTTLFFLSYMEVLKWQPLSQRGKTWCLPSFGLTAQASSAQLCTITAAESPSLLFFCFQI